MAKINPSRDKFVNYTIILSTCIVALLFLSLVFNIVSAIIGAGDQPDPENNKQKIPGSKTGGSDKGNESLNDGVTDDEKTPLNDSGDLNVTKNQSKDRPVSSNDSGSAAPGDAVNKTTGELKDTEEIYPYIGIYTYNESDPDEVFMNSMIAKLERSKDNVFDGYGLSEDNEMVKEIKHKINESCIYNGTLYVSCAAIIAMQNAGTSFFCNFTCLPSFCEVYLTHAAAYILIQMLPDKTVFVAYDERGNVYLLYREFYEGGKWTVGGMVRENVKIRDTVSIYDDKYSVSDIQYNLIKPRYLERGESFCFDVHSDRAGYCRLEEQTLLIGDCPQLSKGVFLDLCGFVIDRLDIHEGKNQFCFTVPRSYDPGLYTYSFVFISDKRYMGLSSGILEFNTHECPLEGEKIEGFIVIE